LELGKSTQTGTILPHILLKTTEAQRTRQIFDFARQVSASNYSQDLKEFILEPWKLLKYCKMGGYNSCTHWVGNLQIGDIQVKNLKFPGKVDQYASNPVNSADPQIGPLRSYRKFLEDFAKDILRYMDDEERPSVKAELLKYINIIQRIYKYPRGQMQLSELLGDTSGTTTNLEVQANVQGEYANPGYVATRLTGNVTTDRVPVIFLIVDDVTKDIPANFDPRIRAY
jgi:hypothetical protein